MKKFTLIKAMLVVVIIVLFSVLVISIFSTIRGWRGRLGSIEIDAARFELVFDEKRGTRHISVYRDRQSGWEFVFISHPYGAELALIPESK